MGVPKFFRYISERYPCLSEVIKEYQIPEFDNLYLDMNGIIHNCSHPNDNDPHFRITEKQIFQDIFHYIEILFRMIQPKKLFFMAIDGVAPRAKMNQQRGRRFRSAKEAEDLEQKAKDKGEKLPTEKRFDSNCITPGTPFMFRLHQQLRYFVKLKVTTDKLWKNVTVILSGHETPGEGEHKIMDYIRYMKSKPDYNPNMRHCLYGLDADLIMLGLCTHEPYFSLLREEVKFNTKSNKGGSLIVTPEETKFFLLHLSLMRDYLELEFGQLKQPGVLPFPFSIEKIIDDWVLMGFLIGNDFIPNLPDLHIIDGAMPLMYKVYREVLPTLDGHINEDGHLNLPRFEKFMTKLASFDFEQFRDKYADIQYLESKTAKKFSDVFHKDKKNKKMDPDLAALIKATDDELDIDDVTEEVLNYADYEEYYYSDEDDEWRRNFFAEFGQHKTDYYHFKLDYAKVTNEVLQDQAECYIRAIQWNLHYYYNGCVSWSWYYPHHYAPYISDIKNFSHLNLKYEMGEPFLPFQQLLAVLPAASKELLPKPFQNLMTLENSPILEYYPAEFQTDLNGKKQDWEAVVLIPFIEETKLIEAMDAVEHLLTDEERMRNRHGPMLVYTHTHENLGVTRAPDHFPPIQETHAVERPMYRDDIYVHPSKLNKGLSKHVNLSLYHTHFPTLKHLKFTHKIENAKVKVFQQPSRNESVIIKLQNSQTPNLNQVSDQILGETILINYPHLLEIRVQAVSTKDSRISYDYNGGRNYEKSNKDIHDRFQLSKKSITDDYMNKLGVDIGNTEILVYGQPVESRKYFFGPFGKVTQQKTYIRTTVVYAFQTAVLNVQQARDTLLYKTIDEIFHQGCQCFTLSYPHYGSEGFVISTTKDKESYIRLSFKVLPEPDVQDLVNQQDTTEWNYLSGYTVASKLSIHPLLLSRLTGSIFIVNSAEDGMGARRKNIGLNIKFSRKNEEVVGFTRRDDKTSKWFYTEKVVTLIRDYMKKFPEVFHFLKDHSSDDIYIRDEVFPIDGEKRVNEIVSWLKEQPHAKAELRPCGAAVVAEKIVAQIEHAVDNCSKMEKQMTLLVKPNKLYIPKATLDKVCPDPDTNFKLFDRVVNIRDCYTVPLGYRGTIIGIIQGETNYDTMYDVVFDKPFPHGVKIRCSEGRGYRMPAQAMINLSYGERFYGNSNPLAKNVNVMRSRNDKNYAQVARETYETPKSRNFYKENSPPVQVTSPYLVKVSRSNSQQSSVSQSPSSTALSRQSSPYIVKPQEPTRNINQSMTKDVPKETMTNNPQTGMSSKAYDQSTEKVNENNQKVFIKKEERCIFSNATPPIPITQNSELFTGGGSFFGYPNLLDIPENKNKLFTGEITASKVENKNDMNVTTSRIRNINIDTSVSQAKTDTNSDKMRGRKLSERSENGFNIPSISDLIKQNNITAKTDYSSSSGNFQEMTFSTAPSTREEEGKTPDSSFTTKLSNLFNRCSSQDTEAENSFKRAISAMVQQSPQLLEKQDELQSAPLQPAVPTQSKSNNTPTIKTEIRKVIPTSDRQDVDVEEEEEVMIIEMQEGVKSRSKPAEATAVSSVDPFQEFLSKMKPNKEAQETKIDIKRIQTIGEVEKSRESNINSVTAETINEFFAEASRRQGLVERKVDTAQLEQTRALELGKDSNENSGDASDMLKKMLKLDSPCVPPASLPESTDSAGFLTHEKSNTFSSQVLDALSTSPTSMISSSDPDHLSRVTHSVAPELTKPVSAFTVVKATSLTSEPKQPAKPVPHNAVLASLKSRSEKALNPCVPSFIPPQVQKQHMDKIRPANQSFQQPQQFVMDDRSPATSFVQPQPTPVSLYPAPSNVTPPAISRGIPILGSQSGTYKQNGPYHPSQPQYPYYYNQLSGAQPMYYPQQVPYAQAQPYVTLPRTSVPNTPQPLQQYFSRQNPVQMQPQQQQQSVWNATPPQSGASLPYPQGSYQALAAQSSASQFQPFRAPGYAAPAATARLSSDSTSASDVEERLDSYLAKLLRLTRKQKLESPEYSFTMDAARNYVATVKISGPHSVMEMRGKPCAKKSDSAEVCARRAFNELSQSFPAVKKPSGGRANDAPRPVAATREAGPSSEGTRDVPAAAALTREEPRESGDGSGSRHAEEKEKKRPPRIAAKFKVPLKPKN